MPSQPSNPTNPTADDIRIPRKRQARLDDNGEPAGVPASKKVKSAPENGQKKRKPAKRSPAKKKKATVPAKNTPPVEIGISDPVDKATDLQEPAIDSDDEIVIVETEEEPEEDDEAELGASDIK